MTCLSIAGSRAASSSLRPLGASDRFAAQPAARLTSRIHFAGEVEDLAAARFIDVSLDNRAGVEGTPTWSCTVRAILDDGRERGLPLTLTGRHVGGGIGPFRAAGVIRPSSTIARSVASWASSSPMGLITAIGCPRSVRTTSLPARTALMALEKCWLASRSPIRM